MKLQFEARGQGSYKLLVAVSLRAANPVIEVSDGKHDSQITSQLEQHSQQGDRICASGNGHGNAVAGPNQDMFTDVSLYLLNHRHSQISATNLRELTRMEAATIGPG
jgi:hypothetical protein